MNNVFCNNKEKWLEALQTDYLDNKQLSVKEVDNCIVEPGKFVEAGVYRGGLGVIPENISKQERVKPEFIAGLTRSLRGWVAFDVRETYPIDYDKIKFDNRSVIFGGVLVGHFGHFILECMSRLWYVLEHPEDKRPIIFIEHHGIKSWFDDFFELLDIPKDRIFFITEPTQFSHITIPEESVHSWSSYNKKYLLPYKKIVSNLGHSSQSLKKIYLTQRYAAGKDGKLSYVVGEELFENFFKEQGFEIIAPEKLPIKKQLEIIHNADDIACQMGSLAHFSMFAKKGATFHLFLRERNSILKPVCLNAQAASIRVNIVDTSQNLFFASRGNAHTLLGFTKLFCDYANQVLGRNITPQLSPYTSEYVELWVKNILQGGYHPNFAEILNLSSYEWLNQLSYAILEKPCPRKLRGITVSDKSLNVRNNFLFELLEKQKKLDDLNLILDLHIASIGWIEKLYAHEKTNNSTFNHIEALRLNSQEKMNFEYCTEYAGTWGEKVKAGELSGTVGKNTPITGFALYLAEETAQRYEIFYRIADKNGKWSNWTHDGEKVSINAPVVDIAFKIVEKY